MKVSQKICEVMHPFPHTVGADQNLATAKEMFREYGIRHLPVCKGGGLCGVLSERDVDFALRTEKAPAEALFVKDFCAPDPYAVATTTPTHEVARRMAHSRIGSAIIVEKGRVVGIFTTVDACRALAEALSDTKEQ